MKKALQWIVIVQSVWLLLACSPVHVPVSSQYQLDAFTMERIPSKHTHSIFVSSTESIGGYQTEQMLYMNKPFELSAFVHNAWVAPPATLIGAALSKAFQHSHYFFAVASGAYTDRTEYRLDSQLLALRQNFLTKPSAVELEIKVTLTHTEDNRIVASRIMRLCEKAPADTPYGGVIAANRALKRFTAGALHFVVQSINSDV